MKIVLVAPPTAQGSRQINDYVADHDDSVELGPAYDSFTVVEIATMLRSDFRALIESLVPETGRVIKSTAPANTWALDTGNLIEERLAWNDNGTWKFVDTRPTSVFQLNFSAQDLTDLANTGVSLPTKQTIISNAFSHNFGDNQTPVGI